MLQRNTHTPLTQRSQSGLTILTVLTMLTMLTVLTLLTTHSVGTHQGNEFTRNLLGTLVQSS